MTKPNLDGRIMSITFTRAKLNELQAKYDKARMEGHEEFQFEGQTVLVCYAKYLIEFLNTQFQPDTQSIKHPLGKDEHTN